MMKLSTVLMDAADMLCRGEHDYSCNAVGFAYGRAKRNATYLKAEETYYFPHFITTGFGNMGMEIGIDGPLIAKNFYDCEDNDERRNARIFWLMWASLMAKEQGL